MLNFAVSRYSKTLLYLFSLSIYLSFTPIFLFLFCFVLSFVCLFVFVLLSLLFEFFFLSIKNIFFCCSYIFLWLHLFVGLEGNLCWHVFALHQKVSFAIIIVVVTIIIIVILNIIIVIITVITIATIFSRINFQFSEHLQLHCHHYCHDIIVILSCFYPHHGELLWTWLCDRQQCMRPSGRRFELRRIL